MDVLLYVALGLIVLYIVLRRNHGKYKPIPGPTGWPFVGYAPYMKKGKEHEIYSNLADKYGDIFKVTMFGQYFVVMNSGMLIRTAFSADKYKAYMNDRDATFYGKYVLYGNQSIAFMHNVYESDHSQLRKTFAKGMRVYGKGKKEFEDKVMFEIMNLMKRLENYNGKEFDMFAALKRSLTNLMSVLLGGHDLKDDDEDLEMFWEFDKGNVFLLGTNVNALMVTFPFLRFVPGVFKDEFASITKAKDAIIKRYYDEQKRTYTPGKTRGLVDALLAEQLEEHENGQLTVLTNDRIKAMVLETVAGGILTTLGSLSSLILILINHPEYQDKIRAELDMVVGGNRLPTPEDRQKCVYTEAVIVEAQRYITAVPLSLPHLCKQGVEFEGFEIPPNSLIIPNVWHAHHDEKVWGDPWNFRPERWLDENGRPLPNDHNLRKHWLAFSVGRRQCSGENLSRSRIFLYLATLLQQWTFEMSPEHVVSCDPRRGHFNIDVNCRPKPYMCRAVPRNTDTVPK